LFHVEQSINDARESQEMSSLTPEGRFGDLLAKATRLFHVEQSPGKA